MTSPNEWHTPEMHVTSERFSENARHALDDKVLQGGLFIFAKGFTALREIGISQVPEFGDMRDRARDVKDHVLANLGDYLEQFEERVIANGGRVHWARNATEANEIIARLCAEANAKTVVKSKSMVTEELELNPHLEKQGIEVFESDLGEYIIQLRKEKPFHIVGPALHLTKEQVSDTFYEAHKRYGRTEKVTEKEALVREARIVLRERFKQADVGITGANFLVAETGSIALVTNEGNADLSATLPRHHIAVTGIEKIVPTLEDLGVFLRLLPRSALGLDTANYLSLYTGPKRDSDPDGPETFDIVLVDNGRSDMLGNEFQDMLRCIRCGACLNGCPVFTSVGGQAYGSVYSGPMGAVWTPALAGITHAANLPNASTFCGKCEEVCPVRIPLPNLMRHWREREFERHYTPAGQRWGMGAWRWIAARPAVYRLVSSMGGRILRAMAARGWVKKLPGFAGGWTEMRDLKAPEGGSFLDQYAKGRRS
ncbi:L-lactate dehydrogenase complex protein LldF [Parvibaculum indicum]|nr:L-lactate dehydrogenase complex protein LldF [Parvibaculum indicum]